MRLLLVDDDTDSRALVERMVRKFGHRVTSVQSGAEAILALGDDQFDVALVDLQMPGMSGAETLRALRSCDARMRLLVVSGADDRHHVLEAMQSGADGYILKDELSERLGDALQEVIAGKSPLSGGPASILVKHVSGRLPPTSRGTPPGGMPRLVDKSGEIILGAVKLKPSKPSGDE
jgi:two-component system OmpR family response regulator